MTTETRAVLPEIPLPGAHLGLSWSPSTDVDVDEVSALAEASQMGTTLELPPAALARIYIPTASQGVLAHAGIAGRDRAGTLAAIGAVRVVEEAGRRVAAIRAMTHPTWRGRGIGRALLAWQDAWAIEALGGAEARDVAIGAPVAASAIDRRRLYAAAGFSAATRIEVVQRRHGDSHPGGVSVTRTEAAPGWEIRGVEAGDAEAILEILEQHPDPFGFMLRGLTHREIIEVADPELSRVLVHDGAIAGAMLMAPMSRETGGRDALVLGLGLRGGDETVARGFLAAQCERLWTLGIATTTFALTPAAARRWARPLAAMACVSIASTPIYTIELT